MDFSNSGCVQWTAAYTGCSWPLNSAQHYLPTENWQYHFYSALLWKSRPWSANIVSHHFSFPWVGEVLLHRMKLIDRWQNVPLFILPQLDNNLFSFFSLKLYIQSYDRNIDAKQSVLYWQTEYRLLSVSTIIGKETLKPAEDNCSLCVIIGQATDICKK